MLVYALEIWARYVRLCSSVSMNSASHGQSRLPVTRDLPDQTLRHLQIRMNSSWPDTIWSMMADGKYYSVKDLISLSGEDGALVAEIVSFLARYGFIERAGWDDTVYTKSKIVISPGKSVDLLKALVKNTI